jgi:two-component system, chemotaxis family, chemotaxis protein CheY
MRALIVDDSKAMRTILRKIVAECGFDEVVEAENGVEALVHLRKAGAPDLVLVDWNMPEMTGIEFVTRVRKDDAFDASMLMMVTTETEPARITEALVAGADEYVMKPFTADALREKIELMRASKS